MNKTTKEEIEAIEFGEYDRVKQRERGLSLMEIRDRGGVALDNLAGGTVSLLWHSSREPKDGEARRQVPRGTVVIQSGKQIIALDVEQLRKYLRWA